MPLGYARDSIANLQSLAGNLLEIDTTSPPSAAIIPDLNDDGFDNVLLFDKEQEAPTSIASLRLNPKTATSAAIKETSIPSNDGHPSLEMQQETTLVVQDSPSRLSNPSGRSRSGNLRRAPSGVATEKKITATYSGFDYSDYYQDSYTDELMNRKKKKKNLLSCIFPFLSDPLLSDDEYSIDDEKEPQLSTSSSISSKEGTVAEEMNIKILAQKENQSEVVAPVRTAPTAMSIEGVSSNEINNVLVSNMHVSPKSSQIEPLVIPSSDDTTTSISPDKGLKTEPLSDNQIDPQPKPIKGILKRIVIKPPAPSKSDRRLITIQHSNRDSDINNGIKRRSILPTYETASIRSALSVEGSDHAHVSKSVSFSPMARVMPVLPRSEMSYYLRSTIWWQRNDYDDFKKTGRIIAKAMIQGGSEIWLQTSNAWGNSQGKRSRPAPPSDEGERYNAEYKSALKKYGVEEEDEGNSDDDDVGNKWWCKFGHSRRGLEHISSIGEGRQRQRLVNSSIAAVLEEQRRQRISRRDSRKIGSISLQYTGWAKDLARAAGEADEEAVKSKFYSRAKCRLSYLNTKLLRKTQAENAEGKQSARFVLSANSAFTAEVLDSHTHVSREESLKKEEIEKSLVDSFAQKAAGFQFQETAAA